MGKPFTVKTVERGRKGRRETVGNSVLETTQGSETSQYLEEKKSNEIPLVVASEKGTAQIRFRHRGEARFRFGGAA